MLRRRVRRAPPATRPAGGLPRHALSDWLGGERVQAATPAGTFDYFYGLGGALRGVWDASTSSWLRLDIGLGGMPLESWNASPPSGYSNFTYTSTSLLGSFAFRYNPSAGAMNYHYLPSGLEWPGEAQDATTNLHWGGHELDADSGLYHFLFRNYAPLEKRWLSPDPAGWAVGSPADPQSWDRYSYAEGSPCSTTDPLGLKTGCRPGTHPLNAGERMAVAAAAPGVLLDAQHYGTKYVLGGNSLLTGIDCSHLVALILNDAGFAFPYTTTYELLSSGGAVPDTVAHPGDIMLMITANELNTHTSGHEGLVLPGAQNWINVEHWPAHGSNVRERSNWNWVSRPKQGHGGGFGAAPQFLTPCANDIPLIPSSPLRGNVALAGGSAGGDVLSGMVLEYLGLNPPDGGGSFSVTWSIGDFVPIYEEVDLSIFYKLPTL